MEEALGAGLPQRIVDMGYQRRARDLGLDGLACQIANPGQRRGFADAFQAAHRRVGRQDGAGQQ